MRISLSEKFTYSKLLRFTAPSIGMMIFTSIYGVVDGFFVSNYAGKTSFAAINLIMPFLMLFGAVGFMVGTGGSALVAKMMGEGNTKRANGLFSMLIYLSIAFSIVLSVVGIILLRPISVMLGAEGEMLNDCITYGRIILPMIAAFILQYEFQSFMVTAEKPKLGLAVTVLAGMTNIILDAVFVAVFDWGLVGAAVATAISQLIGGIVPLIYFARPNSSTLRLTKASFNGRDLLKVCSNGSSEMMSNLSMSIVNILYNYQLMKFAGNDGVAAYGVIMYVNFIFIGVYMGYSVGSAPIFGYNYGSKNHDELKCLFRKSLILMSIFSVTLTVLAELLSYPLAKIFVNYDPELLSITHRALMLYAVSFLLMGFNIFGSSLFTALNNGLISAVISFSRTLLFQIISVLVLPIIFGFDGIWLSIVAAELFSLAVTVFFLVTQRKKYGYA